MRKTAIVAAILLFTLAAFTPKEQKTYTLTLTPEETSLVFEALGELPAKRVEVLRMKILQEVEKQTPKAGK